MNKILTQFKREIWECRASFVLTPMVLCAVVLALALLGAAKAQISVSNHDHGWGARVSSEVDKSDASAEELENLRELLFSGALFDVHPKILSGSLGAFYTLFVLVLFLVLPWYFLGSLFSDRRDQSVLFWKSLPVTESQNVLTKLGAGLLAAPLFYGAAALATGAVLLLILLGYAGLVLNLPLPGFGQLLAAYLGSAVGLASGWLLLALWALPLFCWLLFCSALARRAPFLMATGIPLGLIALEWWLLGSTSLLGAIRVQLASAWSSFGQAATEPGVIPSLVSRSLGEPALWGGVVFSALLVTGSIWLRNYRHEIQSV